MTVKGEAEVERAVYECPFLGRSGLLATCSEDKLRDDVLLVSEDMLLLMRPMEPLELSLQTRETIATV